MNEYEEYNVQIKDSSGEEKFPEDVVIIPIMNSPIFPGMIAPIILTEDKFTAELDEYLIKSGYLALNLVKNDLKNDDGEIDPTIQDEIDNREITSKDIYKVGVLCKVVKRLKLPDGSVNVLVHGIKRYRASDIYEEAPLLRAKYEVFDDILEEDEELDAYTRSIINQVKKLSEVNAYFNEEMKLAMINSSSPGALADLVAFALSLDIPEAQDFLETLVVKKRFGKLLVYLKREKDVADIQKKISDEVNDKVNKYQREYFLREQLKVIKAELGLEEDDKARDISKLKERIIEAKLPEDVLKSVNEEIERLEVIPDSSPEYNVTRTYLNWIVDLPWSKSTNDHVDMPKAQKILEKDHYGLEKAKERIMEFLAVRKLKPQFDGTILCLAGPPGVGKTSMGRSIAESLGRKFYRFSLGGMRDEAEIKGHRRTYVGAMPGRLIQAMKRVEVNNPVIMLDEIDKLGQSFQGDPASALLEVLDPEQNHTFIDHYLDVPFDLSKVLFIATANYIGDIPEPLLDRMEIIELSGYTMEEKLSIATKWVIPKQIKKHGLEKKDINLSKATLKKVIEDYAREPGVRVMEQMVAKLCRRAALEKVNAKRKKVFAPKPAELEDILGTARYQSEKALKKLSPGMTTGLAWTGYGGDILYIETLSLNGKGFKLTGQLGDVMNESANLAYSYVKQLLQNEMDEFFKMKPKRKASDENEEELEDFLSEREVHLHLPAGATPKDGPSAGITMALALYTLAHNVKVKSNLAMTGELSLTGKVLPVGGIKEKVLAAKRAGITNIILPIDNEKDLKEVPERHRKGMKFYPVAHFDEVLKIALPKFKPKFKK
ncbi:endopeptidase La [Halobacteriovorax vibrionivorans]|uniref:Lon protease n=1 Tax=Halobacteriovorax vibrionivorans TaxID=2152716 RepID=A0ABY0IKY3_9BACT|nr:MULTISPECIES: endopeptidase La [Halobacteriovorax]RZF23205.1 endopeptidase La [Halobacteriovorax vibrionivorans]TGD46358.1 endopeptidase La [Halobacteriovorax sp. Y22]